VHGGAGFKQHKAQIPAQRGWPRQAGEQPCCKSCCTIHSARGKENTAVREETVQGR